MSLYAFYDLDRTVTRWPTWSAFLLFAAIRRAPWRLGLLPVLAGAALARRAGLVSRDQLKEIMHLLMLGRASPSAMVAELSADFAAWTVSRNVRPGATRRMAADRAAGYRIVLATAAHQFYADRIAAGLGITNVVATRARQAADGTLGHRLAGPNVYGAAKLVAVQRWLAEQDGAPAARRVRFYTDHVTDAPCLEFADEPFVVAPNARLRALAEGRGWPILDWSVPGARQDGAERPACAR